MADKGEKSEDATAMTRELEEIIHTKKKSNIGLAYQQGKVFKRFKEKEKFITMVKEFKVKKTMIFKIIIVKLIGKYP